MAGKIRKPFRELRDVQVLQRGQERTEGVGCVQDPVEIKNFDGVFEDDPVYQPEYKDQSAIENEPVEQ
jgi:hypothetical protein